jgi:hypothetical protein
MEAGFLHVGKRDAWRKDLSTGRICNGYIHKDKLPNVLKLTDPRLHGLQLRPGVSSNFQTYDNVSFEASWATTQVILTC